MFPGNGKCFKPTHPDSKISGNTGAGYLRANGRDSENVPVEHADRVETIRRNGILVPRHYFAEQLVSRLKTARCLISLIYATRETFFLRFSKISRFLFFPVFVFNRLPAHYLRLLQHCVKTITKNNN